MDKVTLPNKVWQNPFYFIAFGFGSGLLPKGPGTWGTIAAIPLYLLLAHLNWYWYLLLTSVAFFIGVIICDKVSMELGVHDHSGIVWDEMVGFFITMFLVPFNLLWLIVGFLLFRLFDIWKPQPIRFIDRRVGGGFGIMVDDVLAGLFACLCVHLLIWGLS